MVTYKNETKALKDFLNDELSIEDLISHTDNYGVIMVVRIFTVMMR